MLKIAHHSYTCIFNNVQTRYTYIHTHTYSSIKLYYAHTCTHSCVFKYGVLLYIHIITLYYVHSCVNTVYFCICNNLIYCIRVVEYYHYIVKKQSYSFTVHVCVFSAYFFSIIMQYCTTIITLYTKIIFREYKHNTYLQIQLQYLQIQTDINIIFKYILSRITLYMQ